MITGKDAVNISLGGVKETHNLVTEITRRCVPGDCKHCYHGAPQSVSMPQDTIEAIFYTHPEIEVLRLVGGEYTADVPALDTLRKAMEHCKKSRINTVSFVTSAFKPSKEFFEECNAIGKLTRGKMIYGDISNDGFHRESFRRHNIDFDGNTAKMHEMGFDYPNVNIKLRPYAPTENAVLYDIGNAVSLEGVEKIKDKNRKIDPYFLTILKIGRGKFGYKLGTIGYNVHGDITEDPVTYEQGDKQNFGNIHKIYDMNQFYVDNCVLW